MVRNNNETQIKDEKQLADLTDSVKFMSSKFDGHEKERLEREARIVEFERKVVTLSNTVEKLEYTADKIKQYSIRNSILIHGLPELKGEDTDSLVIETVKEKMGVDILSADIDRTHRIGAPPKQSGKVIPVIVKFVLYNDRRKIYANKKLLKWTKVSITESLTAQRIAKLKEAKEKFGFKNVLANDGRIIYKDNGDDKTKIYFDWHCAVILRRKKLKSGFLWWRDIFVLLYYG